MKIIRKSVYGGVFVDKYFLHVVIDGVPVPLQVTMREYDSYKVGDQYDNKPTQDGRDDKRSDSIQH